MKVILKESDCDEVYFLFIVIITRRSNSDLMIPEFLESRESTHFSKITLRDSLP